MGAINLSKHGLLTVEYVRERMNYDPATGALTWRRCGNAWRNGSPVGTFNQFGYRVVRFDLVPFFVHRLIWFHVHGCWPAAQIDHINGDPADNRLCNLREATHSQNVANTRPRNGRPLKGVTFSNKRWQAQIRVDGKNLYLGRFDTAEEAHAVYAKKAREIHGEFARVA